LAEGYQLGREPSKILFVHLTGITKKILTCGKNGQAMAVLFVLIISDKSKNMGSISYYTAEGLQKLKDELAELKTKGRAEVARQLAEARDKGDLSENAEYDAAKDAQGHLELKISKLEEVVGNARLIDDSNLDMSKALILSKVKIKNLNNNMVMDYVLVSEEEANLAQGKISVKSPIGKGLLGKSVGEVAEITIPAGKIRFEVLEISR